MVHEAEVVESAGTSMVETTIPSIEPSTADPTITPSYRYMDEGMVVLCIGDSITEGLVDENYPSLLSQLLEDSMVVYNHGVSGTTVTVDSVTPYTATDAYADSLLHDHADYIMIMFGTNDTNTTTWDGVDQFHDDYAHLIEQYQHAYPMAKIAIGKIINVFDTTTDHDGIAHYDIQVEYVDDVNDVVESLADEYGLTMIDLHTLTDGHFDWYDGDGIHPNIVGKRYIASAVYDWLMRENME